MEYLTSERVAVLGAAGAIGSNLTQIILTLRISNNVVMFDPYAPGLEGAAEEMYHCSFPGATITWTTDLAEALEGTSYVVTSGGAPRREGMTREDLRRDNCKIAKELGEHIRKYAPDLKFLIVIFNPADITGLTALVHSGLPPSRVTTLAALDSTRLQTALAQKFGVPQDKVTGCRTYGGHGEKMAVFKSTIRIDGKPLTEYLEEGLLPREEWEAVQEHVRNGGARIIKLRGRSSFQSPAHHSALMLKSVIDGSEYPWPCGAYIAEGEFAGVMMAADTTLTRNGVVVRVPEGDPEDMALLRDSYEHLIQLRNQTIEDGLLPPLKEWPRYNRHLGVPPR
ncbi:MAG: malate dehydrogenase [Candidatus Poribacteria bacterium]|nr:MAG: malate dehydrogenase [Candidatus Poribacteria bacterium]